MWGDRRGDMTPGACDEDEEDSGRWPPDDDDLILSSFTMASSLKWLVLDVAGIFRDACGGSGAASPRIKRAEKPKSPIYAESESGKKRIE